MLRELNKWRHQSIAARLSPLWNSWQTSFCVSHFPKNLKHEFNDVRFFKKRKQQQQKKKKNENKNKQKNNNKTNKNNSNNNNKQMICSLSEHTNFFRN